MKDTYRQEYGKAFVLQQVAINRRMSWPMLSSRSRGSSKLQAVDEQIARTAVSTDFRSNEKNLTLRERYGSPATSPTASGDGSCATVRL